MSIQNHIQTIKSNKETCLDLGNLGLQFIPDEVYDLQEIEFLNFGNRYLNNNTLVKTTNQGEINILKWIPWEIRRMENLRQLSLHACYTGDISALKYLPKLTYLDLSFCNHIRDFSPLLHLRKLEKLNLCTAYLNNVNLLSSLRKLKYLNINHNRLKTTDFIADMHRLEVFHIQDSNTVIDVSLFLHLKGSLHELYLGSNTLENTDQLNSFTNLKKLNLFDTQTSSIEFVEKLPFLEGLNLWRNNIKDIRPLLNSKSLKKVNLRENILSQKGVIQELKEKGVKVIL